MRGNRFGCQGILTFLFPINLNAIARAFFLMEELSIKERLIKLNL